MKQVGRLIKIIFCIPTIAANLTIHYQINDSNTFLLEGKEQSLDLILINQTLYVTDGSKIPHISFAEFRDNALYIKVRIIDKVKSGNSMKSYNLWLLETL